MDENQNGPKRKLDKSNDTLHFLYSITFGAYKSWIFKCCMIYTFVFQASISCVEIFDILSTFNGFIFIKYGPTLFVMMNGLFATAISFHLADKIEEFVNETFDTIKFLDFVRPKIWRKIMAESKIITAAVAVNLISIMGMCILITANHEENRELFYAFQIFETRLSSQLNQLFSFLHYSAVFVESFISTVFTFYVIYILIRHKFQVYVLNDFLRHIASDYKGIADSILIQDQTFQDTIHLRLARFVHFHQHLKNFVNKFNDLTYVHFNTMALVSVFCFISMTYAGLVTDVQEVSKYQLCAQTLLAIGSLINASLLFYSGQSLQDEHEKIGENAWACPWTVWNAKNRKSLIIILENCNKPVFFGKVGGFVCTNEYALKMINFLISTSMFFQTMTELHASS